MTTIKIQVLGIGRVNIRNVQKKPYRQIWIDCGLMFVKSQPHINDKGNIICHSHVNSVFQGVDLKKIRIAVVSSVDCIIKFEQFIFFVEYHFEKPIFK